MYFVSFDDVFFNFGWDCNSFPIFWRGVFGNIVPINGMSFWNIYVFYAWCVWFFWARSDEFMIVSLFLRWLSMFWGIVYELYCQTFRNLFYIAIDVHITKHELSISYLLVVCVPVGDDCWFVSCLLFSCLVCFVRYNMIVLFFLYLSFWCHWLSCF